MIKIEDIYNEFRMLDETEALALGGSRAAGRYSGVEAQR